MFQYETHQLRSAELIRRADHERLVNEATRARRETEQDATAHSHTGRPLRHRFTRAA
ncbi:hypothetical protein IAG44_11525 [Streptomyces roseirectus]|uniref:Uncharacterized protein n=1 Tax=Streptomyces roseirectus TaxID=2768066 RepID=A0A7H0IB50_9ACTN|nr:hypothetical protein [Streptomyces roseirectus]QNP70016.1 hypothetical protein IAG44_11525 [Streptomyces roseirectus]